MRNICGYLFPFYGNLLKSKQQYAPSTLTWVPPVEPINDNELLFLPNNACCGEGEQDKQKQNKTTHIQFYGDPTVRSPVPSFGERIPLGRDPPLREFKLELHR